MGFNKHEVLEEKMCHEVELLENKYKSAPGEMDINDLKKLDLLYHTLKSKATYDAMAEAKEYGYEDGMSGRGRNSMGRYTSRDSGWQYADRGGFSGHDPYWPYGGYPPRY